MADSLLSKPCIRCAAMDRNAQGACIACKKRRNAEYFQKHKAELQAKHQLWVQQNSEKQRKYVRTWQAKNVDHTRQYAKAWNANNKEHIKQRNAQNSALRQYQKDWRLLNKNKISAYQKKWAQGNRSILLKKWVIQNARRRALAGRPSPKIIKTLLRLQKGLCACCGLKLNGKYHLDHVMPIALGGNSDDGNLQLLTPKCNMRKSAMHPIDYMQSRGFLL